MCGRHLALDAEHGYQAQRAVAQARVLAPEMSRRMENNARLVRDSVTFGVNYALERQAVSRQAEIERQALRRGMGLVTYDQIKSEIERRIESGNLVRVDRGRGPEMTSQEMINLERRNIDIMREGKGACRPVVQKHFVHGAISDESWKTLKFALNKSQYQAVESILTSTDRIVGLQGYAGVGKTTALKVLNNLIEKEGYEVRGFAPLGRATNLLADAGIRASTLQKFLASSPERSQRPRYYILDESSLADTRSVNQLLSRLEPKDRILMVGDKAQHYSIASGAPFIQLQIEGMHTPVVDDIQRQKDPGLRTVVNALAKGETGKAYEMMMNQGRIREIKDDKERMQAVAKDYCAEPNALVICLRNDERKEQNQVIHSALQRAGKIGAEDRKTTIYVSQDITKEGLKFAGEYRIGDHIQYGKGSKEHGIKAREYWEVVGLDPVNNKLTVMHEDGRVAKYDPKRLHGVGVFREEERAFSVGDRIQFRTPHSDKRISTNELGYIEKIDGHRMTIRMDDEKQRQVIIDLREYKHLDHGYAVTSMSSQGLGAYRGILSVNAYESIELLNEKTGYVAVSRAIQEMTIYTNNKADLAWSLGRHSEKEIALDAIKTPDQRREERELVRAREQEIEHARTQEIERDRGYDRGYGISR
jgi:ATP-dependent exoDNAse (exonuclease V) alpha subunit